MRRLPSSWTDWGVPAALAVLVAIEVASFAPGGAVAALVLHLGSCLVLVWRRRWPIVTGLVATLLGLAAPWFGTELNDLASPIFISFLIAYSVARWRPDHWGVAVLAVTVAVLGVDYAFTDERDNNVTDLFFVLSLLLPPYVVGKVVRKLAEQAVLLERQQEVIRREAVRAERDRIARELHDVIAHSVSAMVVQTAAAQDLVRTDPDRAEDVLAAVAETGRLALTETGKLLHVLRDSADELGLAPTPGLSAVPELVERFRRDGLAVEATIDIPLGDLPAALDVSAYRLVQEALTNALRYAPDRRVELHVAAAPSRLTIRTSNLAATGPGVGTGLGLLGLGERVALLGGTLTHGLTPTGRFELAAELPIGSAG